MWSHCHTDFSNNSTKLENVSGFVSAKTANSQLTKMPSPTVQEAINSATLHQLRALAKAICAKDFEHHQLVKEYLGAIAELDSTPAQPERQTAEQKLFEKEIHLCTQCNEIYLESQNTKRSCWHHPGESGEERVQ